MTCGVYEIVNRVNGKRYVGSSKNIESRWGEHRRTAEKGIHHAIALQRAWDKYGADNFEFRILEECPVDDLISTEQKHLDSRYDYNSSPTASNCLGVRHSEETRARVSEASIKMWEDAGFRERIYNTRKERWACPDHRKRVGDGVREALACPLKRKAKSERTAGRGNPRFDHRVYDFTHEIHGDVSCTKYDLYTRYSIDKSHLNKVFTGKLKSTGGWSLKRPPIKGA